ncbi:hypothetical protein R1flu_006797 [Riccia fluitans]|uniref:ELMO domain-containing protein n=1 Tax=Riccia fluitans TaxID=41844 RepID=A0ABD1YXS9_9MARC
MSSGILRRRVHHEDVGGGRFDRVSSNGSDGVSEPLLGADYYEERSHQGYDSSDDDDDGRGRSKADQVWSNIFSRLLAQWAQWFTNVVMGSGALLGTVFFRVLRRPGNVERTMIAELSPLQERRLQQLQARLHIPFDGTRPEHQEALKSLWRVAFPTRELPSLVCEDWKEMGWQGNDPSTDFRGGGFVSLENLLFLANRFPRSFQRLLHKEEGKRATWEYPFAVAGLNITFMLIQMLDLRSGVPSSSSGITFCRMLAEDESAFDMLYCVAFEMMDAQWLAMHASYMEFNAVLRATRTQLERELMLEDVHRVEDMPAYSLLLSE